MADVITITKVSALEGLKALVEEYGEDFVYEQNTDEDALSCAYVRGGEPSCMIGKFLAAVGVPLERLERADTLGGDPATHLINKLVNEGVLDVEYGVRGILATAQVTQDSGDTWGSAYDRAARCI